MRRYVFLVLTMVIVGIGYSERACAQERYDGAYLSLGAGATIVEGQASPSAGLRVGVEFGYLFGEADVSYYSMKQSNGLDHKNLSTMTAGVNFGLKFIQGDLGYLAVILCTGYALQEDWHRGYDCCFYDYCCYNYGCSGRFYRHHEKPYFGVGLSGVVDVSERFGFFAEARYQSLPFGGRGDNKWGIVATGGVRFYF